MSTPEQRIAEVEERLAFLEEQMASHTGLYDAASNTNYPHPNQQVGAVQFGQGEMIITEKGIQFLAGTIVSLPL